MKHNATKEMRYRLCRYLMAGLVSLMAVFFIVVLPDDAVLAETGEVSTSSAVWTWDYWYTPGEEASMDAYSFGRVKNTKTGEVLADGWYLVDGCYYYFTAAGYARDQYHDGFHVGDYMGVGDYQKGEEPDKYEWINTADGWQYGCAETGEYLKDCKVWIDTKRYIFDEDGIMQKGGWYQDETTGHWYYLLPSGAMQTGWKKVGSKWYFFDWTTGRMAEKGGYDVRKPYTIKAQNYVFTASGAMKQTAGWQAGAKDEQWFLSNADGTAACGWQEVKGVMYYFESALRGQMAQSWDWEWFQNGYYLRGDGTRGASGYGWHQDGDRWWFGKKGYYVADAMVYINGWGYEFNADGYCRMGWNLATGEVAYYKCEIYSQEDLYMIAAVVWCEMGNQSYENQLAVANVIMNRVNSDKYPNNVYDVIHQKSQFTVVGTDKFNKALTTGGSAMALRVAEEALNGINNVPGCIGFRFASGVDPNDPKYTIIGIIAYF